MLVIFLEILSQISSLITAIWDNMSGTVSEHRRSKSKNSCGPQRLNFFNGVTATFGNAKLIFCAKARKVPFEIMLHFSVSTGQAAVQSTAKNRDPVKIPFLKLT